MAESNAALVMDLEFATHDDIGLHPDMAWVPFPITIKMRPGQDLPLANIGIVRYVLVVNDDDSSGSDAAYLSIKRPAFIIGHIFFGDSIEAHDSRIPQPQASRGNIFVVPPLSSQAVCFPASLLGKTPAECWLEIPTHTPAPPLAYHVQAFDDAKHTRAPNTTAFFPSVAYLAIEDETGTTPAAPYELLIKSLRQEQAINSTEPIPEVHAAYTRVKLFIEKFGDAITLGDYTEDGSGFCQADITFNDRPESKFITKVLNRCLYEARGMCICTSDFVPVYATIDEKNGINPMGNFQLSFNRLHFADTYSLSTCKGVSQIAYATSPLKDYVNSPFCKSFINPVLTLDWDINSAYASETQPCCTLYNSLHHWGEVVGMGKHDNYEYAWFTSRLYNAIASSSNADEGVWQPRYDATTYTEPDPQVLHLTTLWSDLYWASMPAFTGIDDSDSVEMLTRYISRERISWYSRYGFVAYQPSPIERRAVGKLPAFGQYNIAQLHESSDSFFYEDKDGPYGYSSTTRHPEGLSYQSVGSCLLLHNHKDAPSPRTVKGWCFYEIKKYNSMLSPSLNGTYIKTSEDGYQLLAEPSSNLTYNIVEGVFKEVDDAADVADTTYKYVRSCKRNNTLYKAFRVDEEGKYHLVDETNAEDVLETDTRGYFVDTVEHECLALEGYPGQLTGIESV